MKKVISVLLIALLLVSTLGFSACGKTEKTLTVYTEAGFAPFEYYDGDKIVGVDMDIAQKIADELGWKIEVKDVAFDSICAGIGSDTAIGIAGITINAERAEAVDFSDVYYEDTQTLLYVGNKVAVNAEGKVELASLNGLTVGVQTGTTGDLLAETISGIKVKSYTKFIDAVNDIKNGGCDVVIVDNLVGKQLKAANTGLTQSLLSGVETEGYGVAVKKGNAELLEAVNKVLAQMKKDGSLDASFAKHKDAE